MWAYASAPSNMVMILAMVYGAHLLPFSWLYKSRAYFIMSIIIPLVMLFMGHSIATDRVFIFALVMIILNSILATWLTIENRYVVADTSINA